jgi:hypothetical protein
VRKARREEIRLLEYGADIGEQLAYEGAHRQGDLGIVNEGSGVLWLTLRFARMNKLDSVQRRLCEQFERAREGARTARTGAFVDAIRWLEFQEADALSLHGDPIPQLPWDKDARIKSVNAARSRG